MFNERSLSVVRSAASARGWPTAMLLAVIEVESGGKVFARVGGVDEPLIRFEGHYFDRLIRSDRRDDARRLGLASPKAGAVRNPAGQAARWAMLQRAAALDRTAAYSSVSWGIGQVMGSHWEWLGFKSVDELAALCRSGFKGQLDLMIRYIERAGLSNAVRDADFSAFARGYNGPAYARHGYHTKIAAAFRRYSAGKGASTAKTTMLRLGSKGEGVRALQALLRRAGHEVAADGDFGPATRDAVAAFQRDAGLSVDGIAGPQTMTKLSRYQVTPDERPGRLAAGEVREVKEGLAGGIGGAVTIETARRTIEEAAYQTAGIASLGWLNTALTMLTAGLVIAGLGYAVWGFVKSRRTEETPA